MRINKLFLIGIFLLLLVNLVSASRLPTVGGDEDDWGTVLNDFLSKIAGSDGVKLNETMVNGTNIYSSSINTSHIEDGTLTANDLSDDSVNSSKIDLTEVTISKFTNDANYLDKDEGGTIDGSLIVNGNFTLIGDYLNATVTNQYLNGSFLPDITNLFDIGSSLLKWANLYVTNIYASKVYSDDWSNVTIQESQITNLQSYLTSESDPAFTAWDKDYEDLINTPTIPTIWDESFNNTGDNRWGGGTDTQKSADGIYLYNDTTIIYFNETKLNDTIENIADNYNETDLINSVNSSLSSRIDGISGGNSSFNQSLTDTLYAPVNYGDDWNKTYADTLYASISVTGDNSSWNESYADTLYMDINQDDWIDDGEESDLNVNSSDYWDNLGTINETQMENNGGTLNILVSWLTSLFYTESEVDTLIGTGDLHTHDAANITNEHWINESGDTMTGNLDVVGDVNVTGNITTTDTFCFKADCSAKMYHNGSGIIIQS